MAQLRRIMIITETCYNKLKDIYTLTGVEAYRASREFYHTVRRASKACIIACEFIEHDLSCRFRNQGFHHHILGMAGR